MKKRIVLLMAMGVFILAGQEAPKSAVAATPTEKFVTRVITLKYPNNVSVSILDGIGLTVKRSGDLVAVTGPAEQVSTAETILKQLDVPPKPPVQIPVVARKSIELMAYLIVASRSDAQGTQVPKDLESTVNQVAATFPYKTFSFVDAVSLRLTSGSGGQVKGALPVQGPTAPGLRTGGSYQLDVKQVYLMGDSELIRIEKFNLGLHSNGNPDATLDTDIDMRPGQKVVVGRANLDGAGNALIVILTAKVAE